MPSLIFLGQLIRSVINWPPFIVSRDFSVIQFDPTTFAEAASPSYAPGLSPKT